MAFARLILVLSLLVQSIPGLTGVNCASMGPRLPDAVAAASTACECCGDDAMKGACPTGDTVSVCRCGMAQPEEPRTPPADPKTEQTNQFLALIPVLLAAVQPEPVAAAQGWISPAGTPKRSANSIQSLLCVWVV